MVVDHWHLHRLAALMLTEVRQRATRERLGHRGRQAGDVWAYRRLLLRAGETLSGRQKRRLHSLFRYHDTTREILDAWAGKGLFAVNMRRLSQRTSHGRPTTCGPTAGCCCAQSPQTSTATSCRSSFGTPQTLSARCSRRHDDNLLANPSATSE